MRNGNYCDCNRKNAIKFGGFKKVVPLRCSFRKFYALFQDFNIWKSRFPNLTWTHIYRTLRVGDDTAIRWYLGEAYPDATFQTITPDNYQEFV